MSFTALLGVVAAVVVLLCIAVGLYLLLREDHDDDEGFTFLGIKM